MRRWIGVLALLVTAALAGCGDDNGKKPTGTGDQTHDGTISATISGDFALDFDCETAYGLALTGDAGEGTNGLMQIQGPMTQGSDSYMIDIQVYRDPAVGTYAFAFPPVTGVATIAKNGYGHFSESGSVTFTHVSASRLAGTFSFTAFRMADVGDRVTVQVSEGAFDVPVILNE